MSYQEPDFLPSNIWMHSQNVFWCPNARFTVRRNRFSAFYPLIWNIFYFNTIAICAPNSRWALRTPHTPPEQIKQWSRVAHLVQKYNHDYPSNAHAQKQTKSCLSIAGRSPPRWSGWRGMKEREARTADVRPRFLTKAGERGETMEGWRQKERIK